MTPPVKIFSPNVASLRFHDGTHRPEGNGDHDQHRREGRAAGAVPRAGKLTGSGE
jgi:hypothetical protein